MQNYTDKRDTFYYIQIIDKQISRDNKLSEIFGGDVVNLYLGCDNDSMKIGPVSDLKYARFWKDKRAVNKAITDISYKVNEMDSEKFISIIPDEYEAESFISKKNLRLKRDTIRWKEGWKELRKKYKAISAYKQVEKPYMWLPCPNCGLIPLIWEFNNGRSTACGCGKNEYDHFSIGAESIMSYVKRHGGSALGYYQDELMQNWNLWVKYGTDNFKIQKEKNNEIW